MTKRRTRRRDRTNQSNLSKIKNTLFNVVSAGKNMWSALSGSNQEIDPNEETPKFIHEETPIRQLKNGSPQMQQAQGFKLEPQAQSHNVREAMYQQFVD